MIEQDVFFRKLNDHLKEGKAFVVYRKPGAKQVKALMQEDKTTFKNAYRIWII